MHPPYHDILAISIKSQEVRADQSNFDKEYSGPKVQLFSSPHPFILFSAPIYSLLRTHLFSSPHPFFSSPHPFVLFSAPLFLFSAPPPTRCPLPPYSRGTLSRRRFSPARTVTHHWSSGWRVGEQSQAVF